MSALVLRNRFQGNTTLVENEFIDNYMAAANGEFVKIYLLLLRHINNPDVSLSISRIADYLENTEGDVLRALKYWEKQGLLRLEYDTDQNIIGLDLVSPSAPNAAPPVRPEPVPREAQSTPAQAAPVSNPKSVVNRKELKQILFVAEQ